MDSTPFSRLATVLTAIVGVGALGFAGLLVVLAVDDRAPGLMGASVVLMAIAAASLVFGRVALLAAAGLWAGRGWAVVVAAVVHAIGLAGVLVGADTAGGGMPFMVGTVLTAGGIGSLTPSLLARGSGLEAHSSA